MTIPLSSAGSAHAHPRELDRDALAQPLHRIDQAHQFIADRDGPTSVHREPFSATVPGSAAAVAKESPASGRATEVSPPQISPLAPCDPGTIAGTNGTDDLQGTDEDSLGWSPEQMLHAHAEDLIAFLQSWSDDLDQRSAKLNADIATQERRERSFRLWMQQRRAEMEAEQARQQTVQSSQQAVARRAFFQATEGEWPLEVSPLPVNRSSP